MKIYVLVSDENVTTGHNDSTDYPVLAQYGSHGWSFDGWLPAFQSNTEAVKFIATLDSYKAKRLRIVELELRGNQ